MGDRDAGLAAGLESLLADHGLPGRVEGLARLSGGASRETFAFDVVAPDGARQAVAGQQRLEAGCELGVPARHRQQNWRTVGVGLTAAPPPGWISKCRWGVPRALPVSPT